MNFRRHENLNCDKPSLCTSSPATTNCASSSDDKRTNKLYYIHKQFLTECVRVPRTIMIWTLNDVLTLRVCDFGAPKQVDWSAARLLLLLLLIDTPWTAPLAVTCRKSRCNLSNQQTIQQIQCYSVATNFKYWRKIVKILGQV